MKRVTTLILSASFCGSAAAIPVTYDNEATFLAQLTDSRTYDFETASGFPAAGAIGLYDGIDFDANAFQEASLAISGTGTMTGAGGTFTMATVDFSGLPGQPTGIGFYALDLTVDEILRATVSYTNGGDVSYDIDLAGAAALSPVYFGVIDTADTIQSVSFVGTDVTGIDRAWLIDDLSVGDATWPTTEVPSPAPMALMAGGLGLLAWRRRR